MNTGERDKSKDGFRNKIESFFLTKFKPLWRFAQSIAPLRRWINKKLINNAILKVPPRPYPFSTWGPYTCWESLTDKSWSGRHLPPDPDFNREGNLPRLDLNVFPPDPHDFEKNPLAELFHKQDEKSIESEKSTLLFPFWVQWFTDSFLRTDTDQRLKNTSNHNVELCNVYGLNRKATERLRKNEGGKLKSQMLNGEEYPLFFYDQTFDYPQNDEPIVNKDVIKPEFDGLYTPLWQEQKQPAEKKAKLFAMGVERANVHIGYVMFNVLWLREHNRICEILAKEYSDQWRKEQATLPEKAPCDTWQKMHPEWAEPSEHWKTSHPKWRTNPDLYVDERIFQTARNIVILLMLKIVVEEYVNHIAPYHFKFFVDPEAFPNPKWYRENWMPQEFNLLYRWHSALPDKFIYDGKTVPMQESLWNNEMVIKQGLGKLFEEASSQPASQIGLFNTPDFLIPIELMGIALGREAQLCGYNDYRELCGFPRVTDFNQITGNKQSQDKLREIYGHVDKLEFVVGLFAEDGRKNSALPSLIGRLVGIDAFSQIFTNPLLAPLVYNKKTFTPLGWDIVHNSRSLSEIVHRNIPQKKKPYKITFYRKE
jgi:prostaglandin-endoperoxide synthase 2